MRTLEYHEMEAMADFFRAAAKLAKDCPDLAGAMAELEKVIRPTDFLHNVALLQDRLTNWDGEVSPWIRLLINTVSILTEQEKVRIEMARKKAEAAGRVWFGDDPHWLRPLNHAEMAIPDDFRMQKTLF